MADKDNQQYSQDLAHLIYLSLQFGWRGETDLKLPELQRLESRGWIAEGEENGEYDITEAGRALIDARLACNPEEVSGDSVRIACAAYDSYGSGVAETPAMRAALTADRRNRPAHEKAEPVACNGLIADHIVSRLGKLGATVSRRDAENLRAVLGAMRPLYSAWPDERSVGELLAIIHGDGGHYQAEHGTDKAAADAIPKVGALMQKLAERVRVPDGWRPIDTLECEHNVVLLYSAEWLDADFNPEGIREGFRNEGPGGPILSAKWLPDYDCWDTDEDSKPSHWMPRPPFSAASEASHG